MSPAAATFANSASVIVGAEILRIKRRLETEVTHRLVTFSHSGRGNFEDGCTAWFPFLSALK
jgi:hypothetical protein